MIPDYIQARAKQVLKHYEARKVKARKCWHNRKIKVLNVGRRWRLINRGNGWQLVSHADYNSLIRR